MSNHSSDNAGDFLRQIEEERSRFGATGRFPEGKLHRTDEGELQFGIAHKDGKVIVNFGKPVAWFAMPAEKAREFAAVLLHHAREVEKGAFTDPGRQP
jgi:hypothetical protein